MSCQSAVYQWTEVVTSRMPHLSKPQAVVLALWSLGMVAARSCALTAVSLFLAKGLERKPNTVRQQLREFCYEAQAKRGGPRQELQVESCFAPLLAWVLSWWEGTQLAFAVDATTLGQRFVVLVVKIGTRSSGHVGRSRTLLKPPSICSYSAGSAVRLEIKKRLSPHLYRRLREEIPIEILISSCTLCEIKTWFLHVSNNTATRWRISPPVVEPSLRIGQFLHSFRKL